MSAVSKDATPSENVGAVPWNPRLRKVMGMIGAIGAIETAYLTANALYPQQLQLLCGAADDSAATCSSVLQSAYAYLPGTEIPLSAIGCIAYSSVVALSMGPLQRQGPAEEEEDDTNNRLALTYLTTTMGLFSLCLMAVLFGLLNEASCGYCIASAVCSVVLAKLAWLGGCIPRRTSAAPIAATSGVTAMVAAMAIVVSSGSSTANAASTEAPPPITTSSSKESVVLAKQLSALDTSFYGAFWCGHCYDQKQELGQEAMAMIPYVECSRDGENSQAKLCKEKDIPGYPTWEINGKLYPGEQTLDELRDIVRTAKK